MTRTLNGTVRLDLSNGTIYGVDVLQKLRGARRRSEVEADFVRLRAAYDTAMGQDA